MPVREAIPILLPKASPLLDGTVATRQYPIQMYVNRNNLMVASRLERVQITPAWAKVRLDVLQSGRIIASYSADEGLIELEHEFSHSHDSNIAIYNDSVDTEALVTLNFRTWQYGEA